MDFELKIILLQAGDLFLHALEILVIIRVLLGWLVPQQPPNLFTEFLWSTTEPILAPFRRLPLQVGLIDLSPLVALLALNIFHRVLFSFFV